MTMISLHHIHALRIITAKRGIQHSTNMVSRRYAPAVRSAAKLEKILNIQLFECNRNGITLTAAGEAVCEHARAIEAELREVRDDAMHVGTSDVRLARDLEAILNQRCLRIVCMLANTHHLPKVAYTMGVSYSVASHMIANLEKVLGHALFLSTSHGMFLTDMGKCWIGPLRRVLAELSQIESDIAALKCVVQTAPQDSAL
jgi:LysR family transcriptional regulator of gallate degradation